MTETKNSQPTRKKPTKKILAVDVAAKKTAVVLKKATVVPKKTATKAPVPSFDIQSNEQGIQDLYVDGLSMFFGGFPNSKMVFHVVTGADETTGSQAKKKQLRLTIPTVAFLEMLSKLQKTVSDSKDKLLETSKVHHQRIEELIKTKY